MGQPGGNPVGHRRRPAQESRPLTEADPRRLVVGRLRKPHGMKGECAVFPLTDAPEVVYAKGRSVWVTNLAGEVVVGPLTIDRSRPHHREWLLGFEGYSHRSAVESWHDLFLSAAAESLVPLEDGEVYLHELAGFAVHDLTGQPLGVVTAVEELPVGLMLEIQGKKREFLLPYRKQFIKRVEREARRLVVEVPDGLID